MTTTQASIAPRQVNTKDTKFKWENRNAPEAKGGMVEIIIDKQIFTVQIDQNGKWSFDPVAVLGKEWANGSHVIQLINIDKATNRSEPTVYILNVDNQAPAKPEILRVVDDNASDPIYLTPGSATADHKPSLAGVAEPNTVITILDNGVAIGSVIADKMGKWSFEPELKDGKHSLTITSTDKVGNVSEVSDAFVINVGAGVVTEAQLIETAEAEAGAGSPVSQIETQDLDGMKITPTDKSVFEFINRETQPGSLVQIVIDTQVYTIRVNADGKWSFTSPVLDDGLHVVQLRYQDRAGNWGGVTQVIYDIDTTGPQAPEIMRVIDDEGSSISYLSPGNFTNDATPTITGVAQPGSIVRIYDVKGSVIGSVVAGGDGRWNFEAQLTGEGTHVFSADYTDALGRVSPRSENFILNLDTSVPGEPTLDQVFDDVNPHTGALKSGEMTDDRTPTLSGTADAGVLVRIWNGNELIASTYANARGQWKIELQLEDGTYDLRVDSVSKGGTESGKTDPFTLIIDGNLLPQPVIDEVVANNGDVEIPLTNGGETNDTTPVLRGEGNEGEIVYIHVDGKDEPVASVRVDKDGKWQVEIPALPEGKHELVIVVEDPQTGKRSSESEPFVIGIDVTPPEQPGKPTIIDNEGDDKGPVKPGDAIDDNRPTIGGGGANPGDKVEIIVEDEDGTKTVIGTTIVDDEGNWTVRPEDGLEDGKHDVIVIITDPAGNPSEPSDPVSIIIDTKEPPAMNEDKVELWDDFGTITGPIHSGDVTDDKTPTLRGEAEGAKEVIIALDGKEITRVPVVDGKWSYDFANLPDGNHSVTAQPVGPSGIKGPITAPIEFNVDTSAPTPVEGGVDANFEGVFTDRDTTEKPVPADVNDDTLIFKGKGSEDGSVVMIWGDAARTQLIGSAVVTNGTWRYESGKLAEGDYDFNVTVRDAAGNELVIDKTVTTNIDVTPPPPPEIDFFSLMGAEGSVGLENLKSMSLNDILAHNNDALFIDNGQSQLIVNTEGKQALTLEEILPQGEDAASWQQQAGTVTVAGIEYNVYENSTADAQLLVQQENNQH